MSRERRTRPWSGGVRSSFAPRRGTTALFTVALVLVAVAPAAAPRSAAANTGAARAASTASPAPAPPSPDDSGHEGSEGYELVAATNPDAPARSARCTAKMPVRKYDVAAITVDITLNRYLDHDPLGRMYVLESDLPKVRAEEAQNAEARAGRADPAVSLGLQGDAVQPLTLRVHQGECLRIHLRNALPGGEAASLHLHGATLRIEGTDKPAVASEPAATVLPGESVTYEWAVGAAEPEGTHYFHSHGDDRMQTGHGLFGAVIVEHQGTTRRGPWLVSGSTVTRSSRRAGCSRWTGT